MRLSPTRWLWRGLRSGVRTTRYPQQPETAAGISPGLPQDARMEQASAEALAERCPTDALIVQPGGLSVRAERCIDCFRCVRGVPAPLAWREGYEWAGGQLDQPSEPLAKAFSGSLHILVVDAGDCGACLSEIQQLSGPYYNQHRLGFFITPTPRDADILLVVGPVTEAMKLPLQKAYAAMPSPKRVVAVGACALSGGLFGPSFTAAGGVHDAVPVDITVPGCPPPPLAILHGLLLASGRKLPPGDTGTGRDAT